MIVLVDNFGNCKTNWLPADADFIVGSHLKVCSPRGVQDVRCYARLADVPRGEAGIVIGSSGPGFLELVINGTSASSKFQLRPGDPIFTG
jgi:hypothetical protein